MYIHIYMCIRISICTCISHAIITCPIENSTPHAYVTITILHHKYIILVRVPDVGQITTGCK